MIGLVLGKRAANAYEVYASCDNGHDCQACHSMYWRWGAWWLWMGLPHNEPPRAEQKEES